MGIEMTDREAFEQAGYSNDWELWQAACKYQREKDADIAANFEFPDQDGWNTELLADVILNQGDE